GREGAPLRVVQVEVDVVRLKARAMPQRKLLQGVVAHPGTELWECLATVVDGGAITQSLVSHVRSVLGLADVQCACPLANARHTRHGATSPGWPPPRYAYA